MRIRSCSNPVPKHGGRPCDNPASFVETKQCNSQTCPGKYSEIDQSRILLTLFVASEHFYSFIFDKSICHFRGVWLILFYHSLFSQVEISICLRQIV